MAEGLQKIPLTRIPDQWSASWFAQFIREVLAFADVRNSIEGPGVTISGQPDEPATISATADILEFLEQNFVLATPSGFLPNERTLDGQPNVVEIVDFGPNDIIRVTLINGGIGPVQLRQSQPWSVMGQSGSFPGNVGDIQALADGDVLSRQAGVLGFGPIESASVSDFVEAAQDSVGVILTDTATIELTYTDATPAITADLTAPVLASLALADSAVQPGDLPVLVSGVYTPTLTNVANLDASTAFQCQYMRVGSVVTVSGKVAVDPTAAVLTQLGISLPIASNIGAQEDCAGTAAASGIAGFCAAILGDSTNDRAQLEFIAVDLTNQPLYFSFSYRALP